MEIKNILVMIALAIIGIIVFVLVTHKRQSTEKRTVPTPREVLEKEEPSEQTELLKDAVTFAQPETEREQKLVQARQDTRRTGHVTTEERRVGHDSKGLAHIF